MIEFNVLEICYRGQHFKQLFSIVNFYNGVIGGVNVFVEHLEIADFRNQNKHKSKYVKILIL